MSDEGDGHQLVPLITHHSRSYLDASNLPPNMLVQLRLQPRRDAVGEHPFCQWFQFELAPHRRKENRPAREIALFDRAARPVVVTAIGDHELDLVARLELIEIRPAVLLDLARAGALDVEDQCRSMID